MKNRGWLIGLLLVGCGETGTHANVADAHRAKPGASREAEEDREQGKDEDVALADVPAPVKQAALDALPGLVLTKAEKEVEDGVTFFTLTGTVNGKRHEVEVTTDGKVRKIDSQGDDDDDDDDEGEEEEG